MAKALGECGAKVAILDIDEDSMKELSSELEKKDIPHLTIKTDVLDKESLENASEKILDEFGKVDILINGAGGNKAEATTGEDKSFFDLRKEDVSWVFNLNFLGTFLASQVFGEHMAERGEGVILNISSMAAYAPMTRVAAYAAAKAGVSNFTKWLAVHMSRNYSTDIRVNAIAPGFLLTKQNRYLLKEEDTGDLTDRGETIINHTPMERFGDPGDLLSTVLWLVSPGSEFVHGAIIPIDGGFLAYSGV